MEFRYRITEAEYLRARNLARCPGHAARRRLLLVLGAVLVVLVAIGVTAFVVERNHADTRRDSQSSGSSSVPMGGFAGATAAIVAAASANRARMRYRRDPTLQGELQVRLTESSIAVRTTDGAGWESPWSRFTGWRENRRRGLIVLLEPGRKFVPLGVGMLDEAQRAELRSRLGRVLPTDCKHPG